MRIILGVLLWTATGTLLPGGVLGATLLPFSGEGNVNAGPCSADQTDPAACFLLSDTTQAYTVNGVPGYQYEFAGILVPNPDPDAFPFPTYLGTGTFSFTHGPDSLEGTWTNVFVPAAPPAGCDAAMPFGDPDCWTAQSSATFDHVVTGGTGMFAGVTGTGTSLVHVLTGFPPGNVDPAVGSPYAENGEFVLWQVPEPAALALLTIGLTTGMCRRRRGMGARAR